MNKSAEKNIQNYAVRLSLGEVVLDGDLTIPPAAEGIVLFAHGSGSSRLSSRNIFVARYLQKQGLATLLFDLLTRQEEEIDQYNMKFRFDIGLLADRLSGATEWIASREETGDLLIGYFGASTGAAAALIAETLNPGKVHAIVSRGGRPDLAGRALREVQAPTLLLVGGNDDQVIELNKQAMDAMRAPKKLVIVPGATHLFEEPGTLEKAADLAANWFRQYLVGGKVHQDFLKAS